MADTNIIMNTHAFIFHLSDSKFLMQLCPGFVWDTVKNFHAATYVHCFHCPPLNSILSSSSVQPPLRYLKNSSLPFSPSG